MPVAAFIARLNHSFRHSLEETCQVLTKNSTRAVSTARCQSCAPRKCWARSAAAAPALSKGLLSALTARGVNLHLGTTSARVERNNGTLQVTLRLPSIDTLFTAPDLSPFDPYYSAQTLQAGADFLIAEMERTPRLKRTELTVILPPAEIAADPELPARTREALGRYASAWAAEARQSHAVDLRKARLAAQSTIVFFVLANLLSFRYAHTGSLFGLTGAWVDKEAGLLSLIALELGHSSRLCAALRIGEPVVVMGPTGCPTHIPEGGETVVLAGGGLGNLVRRVLQRHLGSE